MKIKDLCEMELNPAISYIVGLIYPLYKDKDVLGNSYLIGAINHQPSMIDDEDLAVHFKCVQDLFNKYIDEKHEVIMSANRTDKYSLSSKSGFAILIDKNGVSKKDCLEMLEIVVQKIKNSDNENRVNFVRGCFDGRASFDTTTHYISIDVDRDERRQDEIEEIINSVGIEVNINRRGEGHPKNDQIRIQKNCGAKFMKEIGFYSKRRADIANSMI